MFKKRKILNKLLSGFLSLLLVFQSFSPTLVLAQEASVSAEPVVEEESTPELVVDENLVAPPASPSADLNLEVQEVENSAEVAPSVWQTNEDGSITTINNVVLNQTYVAPQNDKVTVTFTKLPDSPGTLTIKQIILSQEDQEDLGAVSDTAYDITSTMENGTFEYVLTLPAPITEGVEVKASEDGENFVTLGGVTAQQDTVTITGLDHFTIFVLTTDKEDYAPTDAVTFSGTGPEPNTTYTLIITSENEPTVYFETQVTTDENGNFTYVYHLDGIYRPNYKAELKDSEGNIVAVITFTDSRTIDSVTLDGGSAVTVEPIATIVASVTATTTSNDDWGSTSWRISTADSGSMNCVNTTDHTTNPGGTFTESFNITAPSTPGTYNAYFRIHNGNTCSTSGQSAIFTLPNAVIVTGDAPDLTVTKTNNLNGGNAAVGVPFIWTLTVTNIGNASVTFNNQNILEDDLPSSGANYSPTSNLTVTTSGGITGSIDCDISGNTLDCDDNSGGQVVVIPAGGSFSVDIIVTPNAVGTLNNPRSGTGNVCQVDPDSLIAESNETNNDCSDSVTVVGPDLTATKTNNVNNIATVNQPFTWNIRVENQGESTAIFTNNEEILKDERPSSGVSSYGTPSITSSETTGTINCTQSGTNSRDLTCVANGTVTMPVGSFFDISFSITPSSTGTMANPRGGGVCKTDRSSKVTESDENNNSCSNSVTIANPGTIVIIKDSDPDDPQDFTFTRSFGTNFTLDDDSDGTLPNQTTFSNVAVGSHTVTENSVSGWTLTNLFCSDPDNGSSTDTGTKTATIDVDAGETVTCTFTNTKLGSITIVKDSNPDSGVNFNFSGDLGSFSLDDDTDNTLSNQSTFSDLSPGTYDVTESDFSDWDLTNLSCTDPTGNSLTDIDTQTASITLDAGESVTCTFENTRRARIRVDKVTDPSGDPQSFDFNLTGGISEIVDESFSLTDESEVFSTGFSLEPGDGYSISEDLLEDWNLTSTSCSDGSSVDDISLDAGESVTCTFTNTKLGSISGYKFHDYNGNGEKDEGEGGLEGWIIFLDSDNDGVLDENETSTETDGSGNYEFTGLTGGTYKVREVLQDGWVQTTTNPSDIIVTSGTTQTGVDFGNFKKVTISGMKFIDLNGNGTKESTESAKADWTIFLDSNNNGILDNGETSTTTGTDGTYSFTSLSPETYKVREATQSGWTQKTANPSDITVSSGTNVTGIDFGNFPWTTIVITKWKDLNADGVKDAGEPGIEGWNMSLSRVTTSTTSTTNPDGGAPIVTELVKLSLISTLPTNSNGEVSISVDGPGTYRLTEETKDGFQKTHPADSFFDIFVDLGGQTITADKNNNPLRFGNAPIIQAQGATFVPTSDTKVTVLGSSTISVSDNGGTSSVELPAGTIITRTDGEPINISQLTADGVTESSLTGLASGEVVDGALKWGLDNVELNFDPAITLNIFVGASFNGQTLNVQRSTSGTGGWTNEGIGPPTTCVVAGGICTFTATKASTYVATHTSPNSSTSSSSGGGGSDGGDGLGCAVHDCSIHPAPQNIASVLGITTPFIPNLLGATTQNQDIAGNVGLGNIGEILGESTPSSSLDVVDEKQEAKTGSFLAKNWWWILLGLFIAGGSFWYLTRKKPENL